MSKPTRNVVEPTTSATERLRAMLTERGVEWMPSAFDPPHETFYETNGVGFIVTEFPEIRRMSLACDMRITPEQAVAATLGPGTCRDVGRYAFVCSECGWASDEPHHVLGGFWPKYCPECGRAVVG